LRARDGVINTRRSTRIDAAVTFDFECRTDCFRARDTLSRRSNNRRCANGTIGSRARRAPCAQTARFQRERALFERGVQG
jgi:hypothetical protein